MRKYIKFFGGDKARATKTTPIIEEIERAESHCVTGFSKCRKPISFEPNDTFYLGRMVKDPDDYVIFGKGIVADKFKLPRDKATESDTKRIQFREDWPYYLQLIDTVFIEGRLSNGVSVDRLI